MIESCVLINPHGTVCLSRVPRERERESCFRLPSDVEIYGHVGIENKITTLPSYSLFVRRGGMRSIRTKKSAYLEQILGVVNTNHACGQNEIGE